jgi:Ca2+-binding RTX toxin-like protein
VPVGDEFQVNTETAGNQRDPQIAALSDGGFVTVWESYGQDGDSDGVFGQRFDAVGNALGTEFLVNTETEYSQRDPAVAGLTDGGFVVAWESEEQDEDPGSGEFYDSIFAQRFDSYGATVDDEILVSTRPTSSYYNDRYAAVAGLEDGGFVVAWESYQLYSRYDVFARVFDDQSDPLGGEFQVNEETPYVYQYGAGTYQNDASVSGLSDGGFVVVWESEYQDGSRDGVFGQRFDVFGDTVGDEFQVNSETDDDQNNADVTTLGDGSFVVVWESEGQDGSRDGIFAQRFATTGTTPTPIDGERLINTKVTDDQDYAAITALGDGGYAVSWETQGTRTDSNDEDIRVQIFDSGGTKSPSTVRSELTLNGGSGNDVLVGGSNKDVLNGGAGNDVLDGFQGDDILFGGYGDDLLFGDSGNDTLEGGPGNDIIDGGEGIEVIIGGEAFDPDIDTVTFSGATTGISVNLSSRFAYDGAGGYDTVDDIEKVIGTEFTDFIYGDYDNNTLIGGDGLYGLGGDDVFDGGLGNDQVDGGEGSDELLGGYGDDQLNGRYGDDLLDGGFGNDTRDGGSGADLLSGGLGDDSINGGDFSNYNTIAFEASATPVTVDLDAGTASGEGNDIIQNVGNAIGSDFNDIIVGTDGVNVLIGGAGDDLISGLDGDDTLSGGAGNDTLTGGDGVDTISGGLGDDFIDGGVDGRPRQLQPVNLPGKRHS